MLTVKKYTKGDTLTSVTIRNETFKKVARGTMYVIVDSNDKPVVTINDYTKKPQIEMYSRKSTAEMQAQYMNLHGIDYK